MKKFIAKILLYVALWLFKQAFKLNSDYELPSQRQARQEEAQRAAEEFKARQKLVPYRVRYNARARLIRLNHQPMRTRYGLG